METVLEELKRKLEITMSDTNDEFNPDYHRGYIGALEAIHDTIEEYYLEKEKQQIIEAWDNGILNGMKSREDKISDPTFDGEYYYNSIKSK